MKVSNIDIWYALVMVIMLMVASSITNRRNGCNKIDKQEVVDSTHNNIMYEQPTFTEGPENNLDL